MWVFGYGSLVWKVDFPYERKLVGYVKGFMRRFYQHSTDHRGTPDNPGRVVTLIPSQNSEDQVWGVAYKIREQDIDFVVKHLDYREKGGYKRANITFYPKSELDAPFDITIYVGTADNFQFAGEAKIEEIARQIVNSKGPSGTNVEYVCNLAKAMREIAPHVLDEHLYSIEERVLNLLKNKL